MYNNSAPDGISREEAIGMYSDFLSDIARFKNAMARVLEEWPISCEQFLSNEKINRIAWLGQSSMCIDTGVPCVFRAGFSRMKQSRQDAANRAANEVLSKWIDLKTKPVGTFSLISCEDGSGGPEGMFCHRNKGVRSRVMSYIRYRVPRGYENGIPDVVPHQLMIQNLAPSYKAISLCILKNDLNLTGLGFSAPESAWYGSLKRIEIAARPGFVSRQLELAV